VRPVSPIFDRLDVELGYGRLSGATPACYIKEILQARAHQLSGGAGKAMVR
jgi:hypothetical protein